MSQISPPIRILLVCAVAFMAAWMLFLRPSTEAATPAAEAPATPAATAESRPVDAGGEQAESLAGQAVEAANNTSAAADQRVERIENGTETAADAGNAANATEPAAAGATATAAAADQGAQAEHASAAGLPKRVARALEQRKVIALLFWTPKASEDRAVRKALARIDRHHGKVLAHATHVKRIARYQQITRGANVDQSPTIVVIDRNRNVQSLVGYVDRVTIDQAVTDALAAKRQG